MLWALPHSSPSQGSNTLLSKPVREISSLALALFVHLQKPFPSHLSLGDEFLTHILPGEVSVRGVNPH